MNLGKFSIAFLGVSIWCSAIASTHFVDLHSPNPTPPYTDWETAATNIQDAIDASIAGDLIWVTNGLYATGGRTSGGALTNRVVVDKAVAVQSVNGAAGTIIQGVWDPATTNGPLAVRCAWLGANAVLSGFTLRGGATLAYSSPVTLDQSGAGVCAGGTNTLVVNCVIVGNVGAAFGGGAYQAILTNCAITGNGVVGGGSAYSESGKGGGAGTCVLRNCLVAGNWALGDGGGTANCHLFGCALTRNTAVFTGGGDYMGTLVNCTVTSNAVPGNWGYATGGCYYSALTNCIVYWNRYLPPAITSYTNYYLPASCRYSCSSPLPNGTGNISADPQLLSDGYHLAPTSPCVGLGTAAAKYGTDIDGQDWASSPSMGCDEQSPAPAVPFAPLLQLAGVPAALSASAVVPGQAPVSFWWLKEGSILDDNSHYALSHTTNLTVKNFGPADAGGYQIIASNAFGIVTSAVAEVVVHCADPAGVSPLPPYSAWASAATNLQVAIDAAAWGEFVLATNGSYNSGGRSGSDGLTNRVTVSTAVFASSVNGPDFTVIEGAWDVTTNGQNAIRCVWLSDGATLNGFTLRNGATHAGTSGLSDTLGGGLFASSANAQVLNCVLSNNAAGFGGGGCYFASLANCKLLANECGKFGGGAENSTLRNCLVSGNTAGVQGGGAYSATMLNCTVTRNWAGSYGGGVSGGVVENSIVYNNTVFIFPPNWSTANYFNLPTFAYSCTAPPVSGTGNISSDPQLLDGIHIATTSPCRGAGSPLYSSGTDIDGEVWTNPPSMGCDEPWEAAITGPLAVGVSASLPTVAQGRSDGLTGFVTGRASHVTWDFGDGSVLTNASFLNYSHSWSNPGDYTVTFTGYNADYPAGVSTNTLVHVIPLVPPSLTQAALSGTTFNLSFPGQPGVTYVVEETTNLTPPVTWTSVITITSTGQVMQVTDTKATNTARFYRARTQ
jgi:hypothetical protein